MASLTHSQTVVMPNRPHDYLYDTNYTVAGRNDHVKAMTKAQAQQVVINPHFDNMFSALRHFPPMEYRFKTQKLLPGIGQDRRITFDGAQVTGADRYKYFRRPIMPYMPSLGGQIVYARRPPPMIKAAVERPATPPTRTTATQTLYRESEAQTDPYSPEYILRPNLPPPELLALATLTYGAGLPAGMAELEMIERARVKRAWEAMLPKVVDQESFERRLKMMEEMELKEWQERELEIKRLQEARLKVLMKVIDRREKENEDANDERVERIWQRKLQEREAAFQRINKKRIKAIRKLTDKRSKVENKIERRDIIADYANYGSRVYAPKARDGSFRDKASTTLSLELDELSHFRGLMELERTFQPSVLNAKIELPNWKEKLKSPDARRERHMQEQLAEMSQKLKERKIRGSIDERPLKYAIKIEKPPQRPPTPSVHIPREEDEEMEVAAILLQKLIRGRICQNLMYQGKERRLNLINELRTRHMLEKATGEADGPTKVHVYMSLGERDGVDPKTQPAFLPNAIGELPFDLEEEPHANIDYGVARAMTQAEKLESMFETSVQGEYVGKTLDFLTKELVRLREERRIAAMVKLAERTRRMREAEESGRRQMEIKRRKQEDDVFRQTMQVHQETVDTYLEDIIMSSIDRTASVQARDQVHQYAIKVDEIADNLAQSRDDRTMTPGRMTVGDLVSSFLIPHVEREVLRQRGKPI
ncbi:solute carrier, TRAMD3 or PAT1-domain-containing protein [Entophlyctis helioformis]|nr:solute carrier, TRAMD3 or PAT1-domain-containing protein [Entophlyctis helioformis]